MGFLLFAALFLASAASQAAETLPGPYTAHVVRVIDGDTFEARIRIWLGLDAVRLIRLADIDTPELRGRCPKEKKAAAAARDFLARTLGDTPVELTGIHFGKYARRVVATATLPSGQNISSVLLAAGHGGHVPWCPSETDGKPE